MGNERMHMKDELESLRDLTSSDFSALAWIESNERHIRWIYASGNLNERYKQIVLKLGRGLSGAVIRLGRSVVLDETIPDTNRIRNECPIMLAEHLQSAIAVPVTMAAKTCGVLLVGSRSVRVYSSKEINAVENAAKRISLLMQQEECDKSLP